MNRSEFQQLADVRIAEAGVLLAAGKWDGAYYLAGYAVECALKACIAKRTRAEDFPPREARDYYTHDIERLVKSLKIEAALNAAKSANRAFETFWELVDGWSEESRYDRKTEAEARDLYQAITDPNDGVLRWIRGYW